MAFDSQRGIKLKTWHDDFLRTQHFTCNIGFLESSTRRFSSYYLSKSQPKHGKVEQDQSPEPIHLSLIIATYFLVNSYYARIRVRKGIAILV